MLTASYRQFTLNFKKPVRTSRGVIEQKPGYLLSVSDTDHLSVTGSGECSLLSGLSYDDKEEYTDILNWLCRSINRPYGSLMDELIEWPSIKFALECAMLDLVRGGKGLLFESRFTKGLKPIPINGLIWMGDYDFMLKQVDEKIADGYKVIKLKIGGIDFNKELSLLKHIRDHFDESQITIRLDANGAFACNEALKKLDKLAKFGIHSIEQPIKPGNPATMKDICINTPIPVALDEELIGHHRFVEREALINMINPQYIILKPSLLGGFESCNEWIKICKSYDTGFWVTSALESNIGLNAIAQYTSTLDIKDMAQGLGTGSLFVNNFETHLYIEKGKLWFKK